MIVHKRCMISFGLVVVILSGFYFVQLNDAFNKYCYSDEALRLVRVGPVQRIIDEVLPHRREGINYQEVLSTDDRVILFGELHSDVRIKKELINNMENFSSSEYGITHLGIELISSDFQEVINRYAHDRNSKDRRAILDYLWVELSRIKRQTNLDFDPDYVAEKYLELIDKAIDEEVKVVALGLSQGEIERYSISNVTLQRAKEAHMADVINGELSEDDRMISLVGISHVEIVEDSLRPFPSPEERLPNLLETEYGLATLSIIFVNSKGNRYIERAINQVGLSSERFSLKVDEDYRDILPPVDWLLHLSEEAEGP